MLLMERNLETPLSAEFIARHVGLSVRQLERLFKTEMGCSPSLFALRIRLAHAHHRLLHSPQRHSLPKSQPQPTCVPRCPSNFLFPSSRNLF